MDNAACCGLWRVHVELWRMLGELRGVGRGAAVRAVNGIEDDGAVSLAPSLGRMAQLTSLDLARTLRASACERRLCADDAACCGLGRLRVGL